jgi:hypothetical protein
MIDLRNKAQVIADNSDSVTHADIVAKHNNQPKAFLMQLLVNNAISYLVSQGYSQARAEDLLVESVANRRSKASRKAV